MSMTEAKSHRSESPSSDENVNNNDAKDSIGPSIPECVNAEPFVDLLK